MTESSDGEMISRRQRKTWMNPYDPVSPLGQLAEAKREHVKIIRGEVEDVAHFAESAKRLWSTNHVTFAEQIGRDSLSAPDRFELTEQLLACDIDNTKLRAECAQLRQDVALVREAFRRVKEVQSSRAGETFPTSPFTSALRNGIGKPGDSRLSWSQKCNRSNEPVAVENLTGVRGGAPTTVREEILHGGQKRLRKNVQMESKRNWNRRLLPFAFHWWHTWARERGVVCHRLQLTPLCLRCLNLACVLRLWLQQVKVARYSYIARVTRRQELRHVAVIMHRTRVRSHIISVFVAWHAAAMRAVDLRGRKSAVHAAAEAEIEAVAAHAELEVVEDHLRILQEQFCRREGHKKAERCAKEQTAVEVTVLAELLASDERNFFGVNSNIADIASK